MLTRENAKTVVKNTIKNSITEFAAKSHKKKAKFQILDLIIPKERKIRSIVGGLETSLGTTLWEPLAKALARENGFTVVESNLQSPANMPSNLNNALQSIIDDRKRGNGLYDAKISHDEIKRVCQHFINRPIETFEAPPRGKGVDIWLSKNGIDYFFDIKTVQPNLPTLTGCMEQVLYWYAYFYSKHPTGSATARIVFPYNPNSGKSFWQGVIGGGRPLEADNEAWVENQFWDFCSGLDNAYEIITTSFTDLRASGELESSIDLLLNTHD